jgi:hypothetical protein
MSLLRKRSEARALNMETREIRSGEAAAKLQGFDRWRHGLIGDTSLAKVWRIIRGPVQIENGPGRQDQGGKKRKNR